MQYRLGIDLGGTKIEAIILAADGAVAFRKRVSTPKGNYQGTLEAIASLIHEGETQLQIGTPLPLGLGMPGAVSPITKLVKNSNSLCLIGKPLDKDLENLLRRPVRLANDANCFALSEACDGVGKNYSTVFGIILGTGCGGGLVVDKKILSGCNAIAGEWGHNALPWPTKEEAQVEKCYCGKTLCNELFISGTGLEKDYFRTYQQKLSAEEIVQQFQSGSHQAEKSLDMLLDRMARALSQVINLFDPDAVVFGGGLSNYDGIYTKLPAKLSQYVFSDEIHTPLLKAQYGDSSGVRGAAWLF